jgi:N-acetylglucosaminyl-diphospho-decaprenol L-rhamnosyltransferase
VNESNPERQLTTGESPQPRLTVIVVNHESWPDVLQLTAALTAQPEFRSGYCRIVVVDNASRQPAPLALLASRPGLHLILRPDNEGFAAGVNAGWREAQSPWILVLNPDVDVAGGFLAQVFDRLDHHKADPDGPPGIVGFGLRNPDGSPQGSVGVFPNLARTIREQFIPRSRRKYQAAWRIHNGPVDWVTGACMLVNSSMIAALGGMDEDFFLYYEEVAFSRAAHRLGWRVEYDASVSVVHRHPLQNRRISPKMRVITRHSKLLYFLKHLPRWQFECLAAIVRLESRIRGSWATLVGSREDARAWRTIGKLSAQMRAGNGPRGREVLTLAESVLDRPAASTFPPRMKGGSGEAAQEFALRSRRVPPVLAAHLSPPCEGGVGGGGPGAAN